jgi:transposase
MVAIGPVANPTVAVFVQVECCFVAKKFLPVDRDQPAFLPPNMYDWLPKSHFVWFVIDIVERLDTTAFWGTKGTTGAGRRGYDPVMLLTLLVYAYACGLRSSREIEARCRVDATFRLVCANRIPDHTTICRFRRRNGQTDGAIETLFTQVLAVCAEMGLGRIDVVSADGTKIKANAAKDANRTEEGLQKLARKILDEAEAADRGDPDVLPGADIVGTTELTGPLAHPKTRAERIDECLAGLAAEREAEQAERAAAAQAYLDGCRDGKPPLGGVPMEVEIDAAKIALDKALAAEHAKDADYDKRLAQARAKGHKGLPGKPPRIPPEQRVRVARQRQRRDRLLAKKQATDNTDKAGNGGAAPAPVRNITDPQARVMRTKNQGVIPAYNTQVLAAADRLVMDCYTTNDCVDVGQATRLLESADAKAQVIAAAHTAPGHDPLACHTLMCRNTDTDNPCNPLACHQRMTHELGTVVLDNGYCSAANITADGPDRLIATGKTSDPAKQPPASGDPPPDASPTEQMNHRLRTPEGRATYRHRAPDAEGVNASLKDNNGLRQFHLRGLKLADFEVKLAGLAHNLRLAHRRTTNATAVAPA